MSRVFPQFVKDALDPISLERLEQGLRHPHFRVDYVLQNTHVPVGFWRSVGHSINAFVFESMLDEVAHATGRDPYELRRELLAEHPRDSPCSTWWRRRPAGAARWRRLRGRRGRGIVLHEVLRLAGGAGRRGHGAGRRRAQGRPDLCAVDPGIVVNPDTIDAQMRGGIVFGLSAALMQKITIEKGGWSRPTSTTIRSPR